MTNENKEQDYEFYPHYVYVRCIKEIDQINVEVGETYRVFVTEDKDFILIQNELLGNKYNCTADFLDAYFECLLN